jgi:hypothetical protein
MSLSSIDWTSRHTQCSCAELVQDLRGEGDPLEKTVRWLRLWVPLDELHLMQTELVTFASSCDAEPAVFEAIGLLNQVIQEKQRA